MNLTQLQVQLRGIEKQIAQLDEAIEEMKPKAQAERAIDFEAVSRLAGQHPISLAPLEKAPELLKKEFFASLSCLIQAEKEGQPERLLYLCRLAQGCALDQSAEELCQAGMSFNAQELENACADLRELSCLYLTESFMLACLFGEPPAPMLAAIADMAALLGCSKQEIRLAAEVAKCRLTSREDQLAEVLRAAERSLAGKFSICLPKEWIVSQRKLYMSFCTPKDKNGYCRIESRLKPGCIAKKEEIILVLDTSPPIGYPEYRTIRAPSDGIFYYVTKKGWGIFVYQTSEFDDYDEFCKWCRSDERMKEIKQVSKIRGE